MLNLSFPVLRRTTADRADGPNIPFKGAGEEPPAQLAKRKLKKSAGSTKTLTVKEFDRLVWPPLA
jgi:hypothetical protein